MRLFKWVMGRQKDTSYWKFPLYYFRIWKWGFDGYILKYDANTYLKLHTDVVKGGKHWRLNIGWGNSTFHICSYPYPRCGWQCGRFSWYFFRSDLYLHGLTCYGKTWKLSLGFVKFE